MRALLGVTIALALAGCTLQYTDENAAKNEVPRASGSTSGSTSSTGSTGTSSTSEGSTGTSSSTSATTTSTIGASTHGSTTGTTSTSGSTTGTTSSTSSTSTTTTTSTSTTGTTGSSGTYTVIADGCPGNCEYLKDVEVLGAGDYVVLDDSSELYEWNAGSSWLLKLSLEDIPNAIAQDANGRIWVSVAGNQSGYLEKANLSTETVDQTIGNRTEGHADLSLTASEFNEPFGIVVDGLGNLIVAEAGNNDIRYVDLSGNSVSTIAGSLNQQVGSLDSQGDGGGLSATFDSPMAMAAGPDGSVYIAEQGTSCRIRKMDSTPMHNVTTVAGSSCCASGSSSDNPNPLAAVFCYPTGIAVDASGNIFVTEQSTGLVREISQGSGVTTLGGGDTLTEPEGLRTDGANQLVVAIYGAIWRASY